MSVEGIWDLTVSTPVGRIQAVVELRRENDGALTGSARSAGEAAELTPLQEVVFDGDRLTWRQSVTRPLRLNLVFDVAVDGDALAGTSKAGRLPSSKVVGRRREANPIRGI
jgi:hypothetical protein